MLNGLDINSPLVQQLIKTNPALAAQLGVPMVPPPAPAGAVTMEQVQAAISERLKGLTPPAPGNALVARLQGMAAQAEDLLQRALPAADYAAFQKYVADGSPGFEALLKGEALYPLAQLLWEWSGGWGRATDARNNLYNLLVVV